MNDEKKPALTPKEFFALPEVEPPDPQDAGQATPRTSTFLRSAQGGYAPTITQWLEHSEGMERDLAAAQSRITRFEKRSIVHVSCQWHGGTFTEYEMRGKTFCDACVMTYGEQATPVHALIAKLEKEINAYPNAMLATIEARLAASEAQGAEFRGFIETLRDRFLRDIPDSPIGLELKALLESNDAGAALIAERERLERETAALRAEVVHLKAEVESVKDSRNRIALQTQQKYTGQTEALAREIEGLKSCLEADGDKMTHYADRCAAYDLEVAGLHARLAKAEKLLAECATEIEGSVESQYANTLDYPVMKRKYDRDMAIVLEARALLAARDAQPKEPNANG